MVEANKAYDVLKKQFAGRPGRVVQRGESGVTVTVTGSDGSPDAGGSSRRKNFYEQYANENIWENSEGWSSEVSVEKPPLSLRTILLGPVFLRVVFTALFAWIWWQTFPLLGHNSPRYFPAGDWTIMDVARLVAGIVYPTYLVVYEAASGLISGFVREVLNGAFSWLVGRYVDLRPRTSSYGCSLYKLLRNQVYSLLLAPIALYLIALCLTTDRMALKIVFGILGGLLVLDSLAAFVRGGLINVWTSALADRVEAVYLLVRRRMLERCGVAPKS
jgi:hypothetical protein